MSETTFTVIVGDNAYQTGKGYSALRFSLASQKEGMGLNLFLMEDGVFMAKKGQDPDNFKSAEEMLVELIDGGAQVRLNRECCMGRALAEEQLVEGCQIAGIEQLVEWVRDSDRSLYF